MKLKLCVTTGTRAEFGLLLPLIKKIEASERCELLLAVTGAHLSKEHGYTVDEIISKGLKNFKAIPILQKDDKFFVADGIANAVSAFSRYFLENAPDMVIILGDRYEMLGVAIAALVSKIPIAHIHGGEITQGAIDEAIRHSITKMSALHFPSCEPYRKRIIQMGENPNNVFNVGSLGTENIKNLSLLDKNELSERINFSLEDKYCLLTFHPVTLDSENPACQMKRLLSVMDEFPQIHTIITKANADQGGEEINAVIDRYTAEHPLTSIAFTNMGVINYLSAMKYCSFVIGNSSSGIYETPAFGVPSIDIGDRQKGRICGENTLHCACDENEIRLAIIKCISHEFRLFASKVKNPFGGGETSQKILCNIIRCFDENRVTVSKKFYDMR